MLCISHGPNQQTSIASMRYLLANVGSLILLAHGYLLGIPLGLIFQARGSEFLLVNGVGRLNLALTRSQAILDGDAFNILIREVRQFLGSAHIAHVLHVALGEDEINFLKGTPGGLGVEEVDDWKEACIDTSKEEVCTPANARNHDGSHHDNEEVKEPIGACGKGVGFGTSLNRRDLSRVEPRQRKPGRTKASDVCEKADSGTLGSRGSARDQAGKNDNHRKTLTKSSINEELASASSFNQEPGHRGKDGVDDHIYTAH